MSNIKKFQEFVNDKINSKIKENIDIEDELEDESNSDINSDSDLENTSDVKLLAIADEIEKGFTNGEFNGEEWDLEVNVKDWIKLDDEDIDLIANSIRKGSIEGNDPIDWKISFGGDSFEEEEEDYTRQDVANQLDIDADELEDSSDLGDMADKLNDDQRAYELSKDDAGYLFDIYKAENDISRVFTKFIGKDFEYNKLGAIFNDVCKYYEETFQDEYGIIDNFESKIFKMALKDIIKKDLGNQILDEKKK